MHVQSRHDNAASKFKNAMTPTTAVGGEELTACYALFPKTVLLWQGATRAGEGAIIPTGKR